MSFEKPARDGTGYAMIQKTAGARVYGVLYLMMPKELSILDRHEGVPNHYKRETLPVLEVEGNVVDAQCYLPAKVRAGLRPRSKYLEIIISGAKEHDLPPDYIMKLQR